MRAVNVHVGRIQKTDGYSPSPQLDGEAGECEENNGKEAFKCLECKLLFISMCHMLGNNIFDHESCRRHLGVMMCKNCALDLIGLDNIRTHMDSRGG